MSKLTLSIDEDLIAKAKEEAAARNVSLSLLVSNYLRILTQERAYDREKFIRSLPPATRSMVGLLEGRQLDLDARRKHLEEKHL